MPSPARIPCLAGAALFAALALFIARLAVAPLGAADLLGIASCAAAAGAFATLAYALRAPAETTAVTPSAVPEAPATPAAPAPSFPDSEELAEKLSAAASTAVAAALDARLAAALPAFTEQLSAALAAADDKRREDILRTLTATTPAPTRPLDTDSIAAPAGAKPRLGRGLLGLIHGPGALASPPAPKPDAIPAEAAEPAEPTPNDDRSGT